MAKMMVLGAGSLQVSIIRYLKDKGHQVLVVSPDGEYPGFAYADKSYYIDVRSQEEILKIARREAIDGILTDQTDLPVATIAYVCSRMGIPGITPEVANFFTHKTRMNERGRELGIAVPESRNVQNLEEALRYASSLGYPLVIKPPDNQGSRGVFKVKDSDELIAYFGKAKQYSAAREVVIEQFIEGVEYALLGLVYERRVWNLLALEQYNFKGTPTPVFNFAAHPPKDAALKDRMYALNERLLSGFGLENGLTETEFIYSQKEDQVYLIETAARGAGAYKTSHMIPRTTGIDTRKLLMDMALGKRVDCSEFGEAAMAGGYISFYLDGGPIESISGLEEVMQMREMVVFHHDQLKVGYQYPGLKDKSYRIGPIVMAAKNREELERAFDRVRRTLVIRTRGGGGMIWY